MLALEIPVPRVRKASLAPKASRDRKARRAIPARRGRQVVRGRQVLLALKALPASLVPQAPKEIAATAVRRGQLDPLVRKARAA